MIKSTWSAVVAAGLVAVAVVGSTAIAAQHDAVRKETGGDRAQLVGTWHLVRIDSPASDGKAQPPLPMGLLIFTADGHEAVQLMYPKEAITLNTKFVRDGYEASYGTYEVDEAKHVLRYRVTAANTRDAFAGTEEELMPSFPDARHLVMRPADTAQHWSVTWEKY